MDNEQNMIAFIGKKILMASTGIFGINVVTMSDIKDINSILCQIAVTGVTIWAIIYKMQKTKQNGRIS